MSSPHLSVLLTEVLEVLGEVEGRLIVDGTFGAGGYSRALLARGAKVIGFDRDPRVAPFVEALRRDYPDQFFFVPRCFSEVALGLSELGFETIDGLVLDIGVSSMQLDEAERGFSFLRDGPLDMRMGTEGETASDLVNDLSKEDLAHILWLYGEEHRSRGIAAFLVRRRLEKPFERTLDLAETIERAVGGRRGAPVHPATKSFQALRIRVNDELGELERVLEASKTVLAPEGKLVVVTFHSLEDRIVKSFMNQESGKVSQGSRFVPGPLVKAEAHFELLTPKAIAPKPAELDHNPRARSAKLRAVKRLPVHGAKMNPHSQNQTSSGRRS